MNFYYPNGYTLTDQIKLHEECMVAERTKAERLREQAARMLIDAETHDVAAMGHVVQILQIMGIDYDRSTTPSE